MPTKEELEAQLGSANAELEALREELRKKDEDLAKGAETTIVVGNVPAGFVYRKYPRWLYSKDKPKDGRLVRTEQEEIELRTAADKAGRGADYWADSPAKHGEETHPEAVA